MKKILFLVYSPLFLLVLFLPYFNAGTEPQRTLYSESTATHSTDTLFAANINRTAADRPGKKETRNMTRQEIVDYALTLIGKPYLYGGITTNGFDCSGFTTHVFDTFGIKISRSSTTQANDGRAVAREEAKPGDLLIFTGTNPEVRTPGHVGIVISQPGDTISFVHSSSNGGVKVSKVEGTRYNTRFLQIRRVL